MCHKIFLFLFHFTRTPSQLFSIHVVSSMEIGPFPYKQSKINVSPPSISFGPTLPRNTDYLEKLKSDLGWWSDICFPVSLLEPSFLTWIFWLIRALTFPYSVKYLTWKTSLSMVSDLSTRAKTMKTCPTWVGQSEKETQWCFVLFCQSSRRVIVIKSMRPRSKDVLKVQ